MTLDPLIEHLIRVVGTVTVLGGTFWSADDIMISKGVGEALTARIDASLEAPSHENTKFLSDIVAAYFSGSLPAWRFARNVFLFTIASMLLLLFAYIPITPGFLSSLLTDPMQRSQVFSQFLLDGLPTTFVANYIGFSVSAIRLRHGDFNPFKSLFVDVMVKILAFIAVTAIVYVIYARLTGAFAGSDRLALQAVGPTILGAAKFANLTAVYLYSVCISSLPLYLVALIGAMADYPRFSKVIRTLFFVLPFHDKPLRAIAIVLGVFFLIFAALAGTLASAIGRWH